MNWYRQLKIADLEYTDIGHSRDGRGMNPDGCNFLWGYSLAGLEIHPESDEISVHEDILSSEIFILSGRVDTCNKDASMAVMQQDYLRTPTGLTRLRAFKNVVEQSLSQKFGPLRFRYWYGADRIDNSDEF